jgi:hypothetical protein
VGYLSEDDDFGIGFELPATAGLINVKCKYGVLIKNENRSVAWKA